MRLCQYFNAQNQQAFYWLDSIIIGSISLFGASYNIMTILRFFSLLDFAQFYQKINTFGFNGFMWLYFVGFSRTKSHMTLFRGILTDEKSQVKNRRFLQGASTMKAGQVIRIPRQNILGHLRPFGAVSRQSACPMTLFFLRAGKVSLRCATAYVDFFVVRFSQPKVTRKQQS